MIRRLLTILPSKSGRGAGGQVSVRHQGGRNKRFLREIDFKRDKVGILGEVESIEYDPNRSANIALVAYEDGERRYILATEGMVPGSKVISGETAPIESGNTLPLSKIPVGTLVHNIEIRPGLGGQIVRSAGAAARVQGKEGNFVLVKLPSGEIRRFRPECKATIGQVAGLGLKKKNLRKAGRKRWLGIRPTVRGVAMHPAAHPHGGGEGRSGVGMKYPKTPWGKPAVGKTRKKRKYSDKLIVQERKRGKHTT